MLKLAGYKGGRVPLPFKLRVFLEAHKEEIINFAVDQWEDYSPEWLAVQVIELYEDTLPGGVTFEKVLKVISLWEDEILTRIDESFEPSAREEALRDLERDTLNYVSKNPY